MLMISCVSFQTILSENSDNYLSVFFLLAFEHLCFAWFFLLYWFFNRVSLLLFFKFSCYSLYFLPAWWCGTGNQFSLFWLSLKMRLAMGHYRVVAFNHAPTPTPLSWKAYHRIYSSFSFRDRGFVNFFFPYSLSLNTSGFLPYPKAEIFMFPFLWSVRFSFHR